MGFISYYAITLTWLGMLYLYLMIPYVVKGYHHYIEVYLFNKDTKRKEFNDKEQGFRKVVSRVYLPYLIWLTIYLMLGIILAIYFKDLWIAIKSIIFLMFIFVSTGIYTMSINFLLDKSQRLYREGRKLRLKDLNIKYEHISSLKKSKYMKYFYIGLFVQLIIILSSYIIPVYLINLNMTGGYSVAINTLIILLWVLSFCYFSIIVINQFYLDNIKVLYKDIVKE